MEQNKIEKVKIVGWSMGANIGLEFACRKSERVESLTLLSMRQSWPEKDIAAIRSGMEENHRNFMADFYRKCFLGYRKEYAEFVRNLQEKYFAELDEKILFAGLDYLGSSVLPSQAPSGVKVKLVHGARDIIAPVSERAQLAGPR